MSYRAQKMGEDLRQLLSGIIAQEIKDPRVGFATITNVKLSPDLRYARVMISVLGDPQEKQETLAALTRAAGFIRRQVGARIRLRYIPEITFAYDDTIEQGDRMMQLIEEIKKELPVSPETEVESPES
ncbi:MAG: 30S ribosome-binding factor RbfA [Blastocatellia bacterium]|nr:30S ribosome-binding factor RbfA [Blastocatellia bacterium]